MILDSLDIGTDELERRTGWTMRPQGACKGDLCVPLPEGTESGGRVSVPLLAERLKMPLLRDETHEIWSLGPESGGRALTTAEAPALVLPDRHGTPFALSSLRGQKVMLVAWASW